MGVFTESMLYAAYLKSYPGLVSTALPTLWVAPKTVWMARYLQHRLLPSLELPQLLPLWPVLSMLADFQRFIFAHALLVLLTLRSAPKWDPP